MIHQAYLVYREVGISVINFARKFFSCNIQVYEKFMRIPKESKDVVDLDTSYNFTMRRVVLHNPLYVLNSRK